MKRAMFYLITFYTDFAELDVVRTLYVVYFDQQTHACACVCMVENDEKSTFSIMPTRGSCEKHKEKQQNSK